MRWERPQMGDFYDKMQDKEIPLRGMDIALSSCTSFPVSSIDEELRGVLRDYRGRFGHPKLSKQATCSTCFDVTKTPESKNRESSDGFPLSLKYLAVAYKHLPTSFFLYCIQLLLEDTPMASNNDNLDEKNQKNDTRIPERIKEVFMNMLPKRHNLAFALKCAITMGLAVFLGLIYDKANAYWAGLTTAISFVTGRQPTFSVSNARGQGTAMGMVYGVICRSVLHRFGGFSFLAILPWVVFSCFLMHSKYYGQSGGISAVLGGLLILGRNHYGPPAQFAIARIVEATIGLTCFVAVEIIINPTRAASLAKSELCHSFRALEDCIDTIAIASGDKQRTCCTNYQELRKRQKNLKSSMTQLQVFIQEAELEPNFWFLPFNGANYRKILDSLSTMAVLLLFVAHSTENISRFSMRGVRSVEQEDGVTEIIEDFKAQVGSTLRSHEEAESIACSFLQHLKDMADAVLSNASNDEAVRDQIIAHYSCLGFCINGLIRETINIENEVKELVMWENPSSDSSLGEIYCKINDLRSK